MSFTKIGDKLFASTLSTLEGTNYVEVSFKVKVVKDKRKTKYAPKEQAMEVDDIPVVMGARSRQILLTRMEFTQNVTNNEPMAMEM
jgi:hypothetical protein